MWGNHNPLSIFSVTCPKLCRASDDDSRSLKHAVRVRLHISSGCSVAAFMGTDNIQNKNFPSDDKV